MDLVLRPWRHYADFEGRSRRGEYWLFKLTFWGTILVIVSIGMTIGDMSGRGPGDPIGIGLTITFGIAAIFYLAALIPGWALMTRRLHDQGSSGWLQLLTFIPYLGVIFMLVFGCIRGNDFENEYGTDPRSAEAASRAELGETFS